MTTGASIPRGGVALPLDLPGLIALWRRRDTALWAGRPRLYAEVGRRILAHGEPLLAYDLLQEGLAAQPKDAELLRLLALALARSGAPRRASEILSCLYRQGRRDEETVGILARTHKDLASLEVTARERDAQRRLAYGFYLRAFRGRRGYYAGINAATLALLLGNRVQAGRLAAEVRERCAARWGRSAGGESYWIAATLGESALILGDLPQAELWYGRAAQAGKGRFADIGSTRRQAELILGSSGQDPSVTRRWLRLPAVVAFTGHRIDSPGRPSPRFPASLELMRSRGGSLRRTTAGRRSRSTATRRAGNSSGRRWASSIRTRRGFSRRNCSGSFDRRS